MESYEILEIKSPVQFEGLEINYIAVDKDGKGWLAAALEDKSKPSRVISITYHKLDSIRTEHKFEPGVSAYLVTYNDEPVPAPANWEQRTTGRQ